MRRATGAVDAPKTAGRPQTRKQAQKAPGTPAGVPGACSGVRRLLGLDPGPTVSHCVCYGSSGEPYGAKSLPNADMLDELRQVWERDRTGGALLVIERVAALGMAVSQATFDTAEWAGRYIQVWSGPVRRVFRREVKLWLLERVTGTDSQIRVAIYDRYGGKPAAVGLKRSPGPLYELRADQYQALALCITYAEQVAAGLPAPGSES